MKYKVIITLLMFLFVGSVGNAQSFRNNNNMLLGKVKSDGTVRNDNNMKVGTASGINTRYAAILFFLISFDSHH